MKTVVLVINKCFDCPYCESVMDGSAHIPVCAYGGLSQNSPIIFDADVVDPDCPLPDQNTIRDETELTIRLDAAEKKLAAYKQFSDRLDQFSDRLDQSVHSLAELAELAELWK